MKINLNSVEQLPDDPIFGTTALFVADPRPHKVNLSIGTYRNEQGLPAVFQSVREAEKKIVAANLNKEYLPIEGLASFNQRMSALLFSDSLTAISGDNFFSAQTPGGTAALRIAGEFLRRNISPVIYLPDPTWSNHEQIFSYAGMEIRSYPYKDPERQLLDFPSILQAIQKMTPNSILLLQASCHNPTGIDFSPGQWQELSQLIKQRGLFPLFDAAYQGLGQGIEEDLAAVRQFVHDGHELIVAASCAKNFGLYGERVGVLAVVCHGVGASSRVGSQFKKLIRSSYSNPPLHGARIVSEILGSTDLKEAWKNELSFMRERIQTMRALLAARLYAAGVPQEKAAFSNQNGMFSLLGLSDNQLLTLREKHALYLAKHGRLNIAGLHAGNIQSTVEALAEVMRQ